MKFDEHILKSKNILITGASKGIGRELSIGFSKYGANVILLGKNENELNEVYDQIKTKYNTNPMIILSDLEDLNETSAQNLQNEIFKNYSCVDGLINNASIVGKLSSVVDSSLETWRKVLKVNLISVFLLVKYLVPCMQKSHLPKIILTTCNQESNSKAFWGPYAVSKTATKTLSEILSDEIEPISKIKVIDFDPEATRTSLRAFTHPAEDPSKIKGPNSLLDCYLWMLMHNLEDDQRSFKYSDFHPQGLST